MDKMTVMLRRQVNFSLTWSKLVLQGLVESNA